MRRSAAVLVCALAIAALALRAEQTPPAQQTPPAPQQPIFRGEIDVIRLDVSVLDKDRRPVRGLSAADFEVYEDGKLQRIVAVSEIDVLERDAAPSAWMRHVPPDVATNDLSDQIGEGRLFAIVMDDVNTPWDDVEITMAARAVGRYVIDSLGPSDVAAVVYPRDSGHTQDFTSDRAKLVAAVEKFDPRAPDWIPSGNTYMGPGPGGGDMPQRFSPVLGRTNCERRQLTVPTFNTVVARLAMVPNRRKTLIFVSTGVPLNLGAIDLCPGMLADTMKDVFRKAQRGNVNMYSVDPAGYRGYENYLRNPMRLRDFRTTQLPSQRAAEGAARFRRDFLEIMADYTGARAIVNANDVESGIDQILAEDGYYYLVGYQTSNGRPDGKFRRVSVKVKRPGMTVRTRAGYWAPREGTLVTRDASQAPRTSDLGLSGMMNAPGLPVRASVLPIALANGPAAGGRDADVAVVLSMRLPPARGPVAEGLTIVRTVYDVDGRAGPLVPEKAQLVLEPSAGDELRYDVYTRLTLAPGRYQVRWHVHSTALDRNGSVYADVEVPDFTRSSLSISAIAMGSTPSPAGARPDPFAAVLPIVPTSSRQFGSNDEIVAFFRIFQGGSSPVTPATIDVKVLDVDDAKVFDVSETLHPDAFDASRGAGYQIPLPLGRLRHGPYLLSVTARLAGSATTRRDVVFRVR